MFFCPKCNNLFDITGVKEKPKNVSQHGGSVIDSVLNNTITVDELKGVNVKSVTESKEFKKLSSLQKDFVYNMISNIKINVDSGEDKLNTVSYFVCNSCNYTEKIKSGTMLYSSKTDSHIHNSVDYVDMIHSDIVPRTRKYICPNTKCPTNKDASLKEAVFFRTGESYDINYICSVCSTTF